LYAIDRAAAVREIARVLRPGVDSWPLCGQVLIDATLFCFSKPQADSHRQRLSRASAERGIDRRLEKKRLSNFSANGACFRMVQKSASMRLALKGRIADPLQVTVSG